MDSSSKVKDFYNKYKENITTKRYLSNYPIRRYAHLTRIECLLDHLETDKSLLEVGCGDGFFAIQAAKKGIKVTGVDLSESNIKSAIEMAKSEGVENLTTFFVADAENLPFSDSDFDIVLASHILEHLPHFKKGIDEVFRVTKYKAIIALPTPLNPCSAIILGGKSFWYFSRSGIIALFWGLIRILYGMITLKIGVDEGSYASMKGLPHIWFFPWKIKSLLLKTGFTKVNYEPDSLPLPYFNFLLHLSRFFEKFKSSFFIKHFGYGTHFICKKS